MRLLFITILSFLLMDMAWADTCSDLVGLRKSAYNDKPMELVETIETRINRIINLSDFNINRQEYGSNEYYFTNQSGYFVYPVCPKSDDPDEKNVRFRRAGFHPIGLMVKPIGGIVIGNKDYVFCRSEHGIGMIVPKNRLTKIEKETVYLFSRGSYGAAYCTGTPDCVQDEDIQNSKTQKILTPSALYAVINGSYAQILLKIQQQKNDGCSQPLAFELDLYASGHQRRNETGTYISLCGMAMNQNNEPVHGYRGADFKIETYETAKECFEEYPFVGCYFKIDDEMGRFLSDLLDFTLSTECEQGMTLNENVCRLEADSEYKDIFDRIKNQCTTPYTLLFDYAFHTNPSSCDTAKQPIKLDFQFHQKILKLVDCQDKRPSKASELIIFHDRFINNHCCLDISEITQAYSDAYLLKGFKKTTHSSQLQAGIFWEIQGFDQYYPWLDIFSEHIFKALKKKESMDYKLDKRDRAERKKIAEFFASLIISTSFDFPDN